MPFVKSLCAGLGEASRPNRHREDDGDGGEAVVRTEAMLKGHYSPGLSAQCITTPGVFQYD